MNKYLFSVLALAFLCFGLNAQSGRSNDGDIIRCYTMEADAIRRAADPSLGTLENFEQWLAPKIREYEQSSTQQRAVITIPIVFHIIHNNGSDNLSATYINAQIDQLNQDFRKYGDGANSHPAGADVEIQFCAATINPSGGTMAEPGIDRVSRTSKGFTAPPYSQSYYENTIKPNTIWDPTQYCNVWVSDLSGGLLGYAQFPEASSLPGIGTGNGGANTDGVVVLYSSVGSIATPHPSGGVYAAGRTLTHELGHWLGLRHIWGDGGCNVDDYCNDTPRASSATSGCPTKNTCNDLNYGASSDPNDMVENYMDYSYDACMNIFTNDQKARMQTVMASSVRRASLASSTKCGGGGTSDTEAPTTPTSLTASAITTTTATLSWNASSDNVGVTGYDVYVNGTLLGSVTGTSANLTGLTSSTTYSAAVRAKDAAGNQSGQATTSFTTLSDGGSNCATSNVTLTIVLDNYPEETSWTIKTSGGTTVASGGTYASSPDGSTITQNITLADGSYTFTINDSYGDGICCSYGSGSYSLTSGGLTLASGGQFTSSESTNFCVDGGGPAPDTEAPSTPTGVSASAITQTSATISWNASTDNVGVTAYAVYVDGSLAGTTSGTSLDLTGLTAATTYNVSVTAQDAAGNVSGSGSTSFTTLSGGGTGGTDLLFAHYFETGWDGWVDGGSDCARYAGSRSWEGSYSIQLRDNSGTASSMTLNNVDVTGYDQLDLTFFFYASSMENGEDFWVRVNDGSGWQTVATYARGSSFNNNTFYTATVTLNAGSFSFNSGFDFRFQCDASANNDLIYIDQVTLTGTSGGRSLTGTTQSITELGTLDTEDADEALELIDLTATQLVLYPNPAKDFIKVATGADAEWISIYTVTGVEVAAIRAVEGINTIDVAALEAGTYIVRVQTEGKVLVDKFIKY